MRCCYLAETISISPNPGIKCCVGDNKICNILCYHTAKATLKKVNKLIGDDLWTGESTICICSHHVEHHCTIRDENGWEITVLCQGNDEHCNCEEFRTCSIRLSHRKCYKMVTEV